jgi:hypothetical protein
MRTVWSVVIIPAFGLLAACDGDSVRVPYTGSPTPPPTVATPQPPVVYTTPTARTDTVTLCGNGMVYSQRLGYCVRP